MTHLNHLTDIYQNQKCCPMSLVCCEFHNNPILLYHDDVITSSFTTKIVPSFLFMTEVDSMMMLRNQSHIMHLRQ